MPNPKCTLTETQIELLARPIATRMLHLITAFYEDPKNVEGFKAWYKETYGREPTSADYAFIKD